MPRKLTKKEIQERINKIHGEKYILKGEYINSKKPIDVLCTKCNKVWEAHLDSLFKGFGCPRCSRTMKKNTEIIKNEVYNLVGNEYEVLGEYVNTHTKILFRHNKCGNEFLMSPKSFIHDSQRCPKERYDKSSAKNSIVQGKPEEKNKQISDICKNEGYQVIKGYVRSKIPLEILHLKCNKIFKPLPRDFIKGTRCPYCYKSKGEEIIKEYLLQNNISFKEQYRIKECRNKRPLPFDFAIFENDKLLFLIEYDGSQHFSPKFAFNKNSQEFIRLQTNDKIKNEFCKKNNILLIRIKYVRSENPSILKNKIITVLENEFGINNMAIPSQANYESIGRCRD
ncbi:MAG: hypothetical protein HFE58_10670 [Firmicutes bacterium]|jgi:hypothetical protein|nr:hypothetical protein [Bacillota bacterium]